MLDNAKSQAFYLGLRYRELVVRRFHDLRGRLGEIAGTHAVGCWAAGGVDMW